MFSLYKLIYFSLSQNRFSYIMGCNQIQVRSFVWVRGGNLSPTGWFFYFYEPFLQKTGLPFLSCDVSVWMWPQKIILWTIYSFIKWHWNHLIFLNLQVRRLCSSTSISSFQVACSRKICFWTTTSGFDVVFLSLQEASSAIPLFSPVIVPMAQSFGPILSQLTSYPTIRFGVRCVSVNYWLWCQNYCLNV